MGKQYMVENPNETSAQFLESLRVVDMKEAVSQRMSENLNTNVGILNEIIGAGHLTDDEQIELANSLVERLFYILDPTH